MSKKPSGKVHNDLVEQADARREIARRLSLAESLVALTHARPDGDGLGSMAALARAARAAGKTVQLTCLDLVPAKYAFLLEGEGLLGAGEFAGAAAGADCIVVLDTCAFSQLDRVAETLRQWREKTVVIDHHQTRDDVGFVRWCDESAAAVGVMVAEVLDRLDWPFDARTAEAAMAAICSDTGWLRFSNTDARCLKAVARCLEAGVDPAGLYRRLYESDRSQRIALIARALSTMQFHAGGRIALLQVTRNDLLQTGALPEETENLINEALRIGNVELAVLLVETAGDVIRGSLRSKKMVDVAALAETLGGGGHQRAAGFRRAGRMEQVAAESLAAALTALDVQTP